MPSATVKLAHPQKSAAPASGVTAVLKTAANVPAGKFKNCSLAADGITLTIPLGEGERLPDGFACCDLSGPVSLSVYNVPISRGA
jgi:hypothetical protein